MHVFSDFESKYQLLKMSFLETQIVKNYGYLTTGMAPRRPVPYFNHRHTYILYIIQQFDNLFLKMSEIIESIST